MAAACSSARRPTAIRDSDIADFFGSRFLNAGWVFTAQLTPGTYIVSVYAHSTASGTWNQSQSRTITVMASYPLTVVEQPAPNAVLPQPFLLSGWAVDFNSGSGSGVDRVEILAYPNPGSGAPAISLGDAIYGIARTDVAAVHGAQFTNSGYHMQIRGLAPGVYRLAPKARSLVTQTFNEAAGVTVTVQANPHMNIDVPSPNSAVNQNFTFGGWAIDEAASSGTGVNTLHVWAYPNPGSGQAPIFLGVPTFGARPDVAALYGSQFLNSGWSLTASLSPGTYYLYVAAWSTVTNSFNQAQGLTFTVATSNPVLAIDLPTPSSTGVAAVCHHRLGDRSWGAERQRHRRRRGRRACSLERWRRELDLHRPRDVRTAAGRRRLLRQSVLEQRVGHHGVRPRARLLPDERVHAQHGVGAMDVANPLGDGAMTARINGRETTMITTMESMTTRLALMLAISASLLPASVRAQEPPVREAAGVEDVRQLLIAAYPEVREGRVNWRVTTTAAGLLVEAHRIESPFTPLPPATDALVSGTAVVDQSGHIESLTAGGTVLSALRTKAAALLTRRPRDVGDALAGEGAKYPPGDGAKVSSLVPVGVQTVLKTSVARAQTFRADPPPNKGSEALTWQLEVEGADAAASAFTLVFEPIEGRLMSVVRR